MIVYKYDLQGEINIIEDTMKLITLICRFIGN